ncbi:MAG TPA: hypothetical protein VFZ65_02395 [Planctomycetota bacterium]|nr:hypothetical protein [Planctomycetota bacterium]
MAPAIPPVDRSGVAAVGAPPGAGCAGNYVGVVSIEACSDLADQVQAFVIFIHLSF